MRRHSIKMPRSNKLDTVWEPGVYVGQRTISGESMIATQKGMYKTRTIRRVPAEERWVEDNLKFFRFCPWKVNSGADEAEQVMTDIIPPAPSPHPTVAPELPDVVVRLDVPRRQIYRNLDTWLGVQLAKPSREGVRCQGTMKLVEVEYRRCLMRLRRDASESWTPARGKSRI